MLRLTTCVAILVLSFALAMGAISTAATPPGGPTAMEIMDPSRHWIDNGFVLLTPAIRVSTTPGSKTAIYLRIPDGQRIATRPVPHQARYTLELPPGSMADRISYSTRADGRLVIHDVRGTRWDEDGTEFFHVYRPAAESENAPLIGFEWRRDDPEQQETATTLLTELIRSASDRFPSLYASKRDIERFRRLNNCQTCHIANKEVAERMSAALPPWQTDARGLYVPLAVLHDQAPLSATPYFDDPNADDPNVQATCAVGRAERNQNAASRWFSCDDGSNPVGHYDLADSLGAGEQHAQQVCAARRYLYSRLDDLGHQAFAYALRPCDW